MMRGTVCDNVRTYGSVGAPGGNALGPPGPVWFGRESSRGEFAIMHRSFVNGQVLSFRLRRLTAGQGFANQIVLCSGVPDRRVQDKFSDASGRDQL